MAKKTQNGAPALLTAVWFGLAGFAACSTIVWVWNGVRVTDRAFEQLVEDVAGDVNPDAALVMLETKVIDAVRAIAARRDAEGRLGMLARNALTKVSKETASDTATNDAGSRPGEPR